MIRRLFPFLLMVAGCAAPRVAHEYQRDSVMVVVRDTMIMRDTIVQVSIPEGYDKAVLPDTDTSRLRTQVAESEAFVKDGRLHHTLRNREAVIPIRMELPKAIHQERHYLLQERKVKEYIEVEKELSRWQKFLQSVGLATIVAAVGWIALRLLRRLI